MDKYFTTKDSVNLRYSEDYVDNSKAVVIIVHGFAEHLNRYDYITKKLNDRNISVFRYDARGHGLSSGKKGHMDSYMEMVDDLYEIYNFVKSKNENKKIYTLGHSMGGSITANFGIKFPNLLDGQLFSGAAIGYFKDINPVKKTGVKFLGSVFPKTYIPNPVSDICSDPKVVIDYNNDPLVLKKATTGFFKEFSIRASENVLNNLKNYHYPCYIGHGEKDKIISKEASKRFYNDISSTDKTLKIYPCLYHEIFNEKIKNTVIEDYIKWLEKRI